MDRIAIGDFGVVVVVVGVVLIFSRHCHSLKKIESEVKRKIFEDFLSNLDPSAVNRVMFFSFVERSKGFFSA